MTLFESLVILLTAVGLILQVLDLLNHMLKDK